MPKIDNEKLEAYAQMIYERENQFSKFTLETIAKRIKATGQLSAYDQTALKNIADISGDIDKITKELAKITGMNIKDIEKIYTQVINDGVNTYKPLYDLLGREYLPITENEHAMKLVRHWAELTSEKMINLSHTKALGFVDQNGNFTQLAGAYQRTIDDAVVAVSNGTSDFNSAMKGTIESLGGSGIEVWYGGGVHRSLESMVRQNLLWGAKQAAQSYDDYVSEDLGLDGFEVDAHAGCRPSHEFMQGKMFSYNGTKVVDGVEYPDGAEALKRLEDYNCLHFKTGVLLGVSQPTYSQEELDRIHKETTETIEYNGKEKTLYEWKQTQRRLEREYRKAQTQSDMFKASGNNVAARDYRDKAKAIRDTYDDLTNKVPGLYDHSERMRTYFNSTASVNGATPTPKKVDVMAEKKIAYDDAQKIISKYGNRTQLMLSGNLEDLQAYSELMQKAKGYEPPKPKIVDYKEQITKNVDSLSPSRITPKTITKAQEDAISSYSRTGYTDINNYLRFGTVPKQMPKSKMLQYVDDLNALLDANPLQEEIFVKRGINTRALNQMLGTETITDASAVGKVITDKGFMSTTPYKMGGFGGNTQLFIKCPKGTKGTYIADWCANPAEKEFLIAPNQKMIVRKIEKEMVWDEPHYKVFVDIITGG